MTIQPQFQAIVDQIGQVVLGKNDQIRMALTCLLAKGHLLIEDIPGIGKTTLAKVLSRSMGLEFRRVQFTSDMLPGDILGSSIFDQNTAAFVFHPGPIFTQVLLADEINRATPKTQSALLEAMEERQVTSDGKTRRLAAPFFVIATQNPLELSGTFPLPESQLDRFLMRIELGYPDREAERRLLGGDRPPHQAVETLEQCLSPENVLELQEQVEAVHVADAVVSYLQDLLEFSRGSRYFHMGLSPRAGLALLHAARSWAFISGRDYVLPEDLQAVINPVVGHRLRSRDDLSEIPAQQLTSFFKEVAVP
ncbi:ATPase AAA [Desulfosarcina ovata subsp. sediminis]|uniref:ATPase AAA n=1 Tax=Desulfosarcina ovata subsp. sediminis TaxID=885957 RepID=A0A5K7ZYP6_9BACT|nr:MoxR family ATPase [Desulfosarcina ovata]BBO85264.1 ATPase AAA [Desulfosarcina ovata subsp. sediminis]